MIRIIAVLVLVIPGIFAALGIKLMRDSLFSEVHKLLINTEFQFVIGLVLCIGGIWFIAGFIVHRDRKRQNLKKKRRD